MRRFLLSLIYFQYIDPMCLLPGKQDRKPVFVFVELLVLLVQLQLELRRRFVLL